MASLSLKISIAEKNLIKTIQFDPSQLVYEACHAITEKIAELNQGLGQGKTRSSRRAQLQNSSPLSRLVSVSL